MTIKQVELANTFDVWRIATNQTIDVINDLKEGNLLTTGTISIDNPSGFEGNVSLNVKSGMISGDGGLLSNVGIPSSITNQKLQNSTVLLETTQKQLTFSSNTLSLGSTVYFNVVNLVVSTADTSTSNIPSANLVNTVHSLASQANTVSIAAYQQANIARDQANDAYTLSNTANALANSVSTTIPLISAAINRVDANTQFASTQANTARDQANAAYAFANTRFSANGGTINGDVVVAGSLSVVGNTYLVNTNTLNIADPLIYLAANNYSSDVVDIGFTANYVNTTGQNVHTGVFRDATNKEWYIFQEYNAEPINNNINPSGNNFTLAVLNADIRSSNINLGGSNAISWISSSYNQANAAYAITNTVNVIASVAYNKANAANIIASSAYDKANAANVIASAAFDFANNGTSAVALAAFNKANAVSTNTISLKIGAAGDVPGLIAITNNFIYFSTNTYNGTSNVWRSIPVAGDFGQEAPYMMLPYFYGTPSSANALIFMTTAVVPFYLPANLVGSNARSRVVASGTTAVLTMYKNTTNIGVINFAQTTNIANFSFASSQSFVPGDVFTIVNNPTPDAGLTDISFSLLGYRR